MPLFFIWRQQLKKSIITFCTLIGIFTSSPLLFAVNSYELDANATYQEEITQQMQTLKNFPIQDYQQQYGPHKFKKFEKTQFGSNQQAKSRMKEAAHILMQLNLSAEQKSQLDIALESNTLIEQVILEKRKMIEKKLHTMLGKPTFNQKYAINQAEELGKLEKSKWMLDIVLSKRVFEILTPEQAQRYQELR